LASHGFLRRRRSTWGSFLAHHTGCQYTHNQNAYVFVVRIDAGRTPPG
jgi:hypothetical protein